MNADEAVRTYDCKVPGCTREAKSNRGRFAYLCDEHHEHAQKRAATARASSNGGVVARSLKDLTALAAAVDKAHERARKLTEQALDAKHDADAKAAEFRAEARRLLQDDEGEVRV